MTERLIKAETVFHEALGLPTEAREAFVREACGGDADLQREVAALLRAASFADRWLGDSEVAAAGSPSNPNPVEKLSEGPGTVVGRYKLLEKIGEGGFGAVYMAEQQEPVRRNVALKIIKVGMDTRTFIARFEAERQALALMDHPNIAKVFDAGATGTGRPYFVMELVRGVSITRFCEQGSLGVPERLELLIQVCNAIQHAHQKGIIHRDIKPANVLVTLNEGVPHPMVIDFGVAKAMTQRLTDKTLYTHFAQMIGTPAYMSPEQAEMSKSDVDTRSDIYSLGVLLYELLTQTTPFPEERLRRAGYAGIQRIICEERPPRPSTRLKRALSSRPNSAFSRRPSPLATDLDWIVMKCLEKDRRRRYPTANGLAMDIERHLRNEPIVARPPSRLYEFGKTVRRHKGGFAAAAVVLLALVSGLIGVLWQWRHTLASERTARQNAYAADISGAQTSLEEGDYGSALSLLKRYFPESTEGSETGRRTSEDLRNWEWRYLWGLCQSDELFTLHRYGTWVGGIAVSPEGSTLAVQTGDNRVALWDPLTRLEITNLPASGFRGTIAFSPTENLLAAANVRAGSDPEVALWNLGEMRARAGLPHEAAVLSLAFSADGRFLATKDSLGIVRVWEMASAQVLTRFDAAGSRLLADRWPSGDVLRFSPDGTLLAFENRFSGLRVVNWRTREDNLVIDPPTRSSEIDPMLEQITAVKFAPNGSLLVWSVGNGKIHLLDLAAGESAGELAGHDGSVLALVFSPDGKRLVSAGADQTVRIWDLAGRHQLRCLHGHENEVWGIDFLPDGETLVSGGKDGSVRFWDAGQSASPPRQRLLPVLIPQFLRDGRQFIAVDSPQESISLWSTLGLNKLATFTELGTNNYCFGLSANEQWLAVAPRYEQVVQIWDWRIRTHVTNLAVPARADGAGFSPDNQYVYAACYLPSTAQAVSETETWKVWKTDSWEEVKLDWLRPNISKGHIAPDGRSVAIGYETGEIEVRSFPEGRLVVSFPGYPSRVQDVRFSPDGRLLAATSWDGFVKVWDVASRTPLMTLRSRLTQVSIEFFPNNRRLAIGEVGGGVPGGRVKIWDLATQRELLTLPGAAWNVTFSPDGNTLTAMREMGTAWTLQTWSAPSLVEIDAEALAER